MFGSKRGEGDNPFGAGQGSGSGGGATSFLPEDYLQRKWESRANAISLMLFGVVLFGVVGAFFVTHRAWNAVRAQQREINTQYTEQTKKIEQLKVLEQQKTEMLEKADMTTSLIEKVPRSILMAEIVNRMPERLTLTDLQLQSKRIAEPAASTKVGAQSIAKAPAKGAKPAPAKKDAVPEAPKLAKPPKMEFSLTIMGLAATDEAVADFQAALKKCELLDRVEHVSSIASTVDSVSMRKFRIEAQLRPDADARKIDPLRVARSGHAEGALAGVGDVGGPRVYDAMDPTAPAPASLPDPMKPR